MGGTPAGAPPMSVPTGASVRNGRLHEARHNTATVLLILGVSERAFAPTERLDSERFRERRS